jgi:DNA-binding NarL/FixJ family response regulator
MVKPSRIDQRTAVKVLIIGPHHPTRLSLERILEQPGEFRCVGSYPDGDQAVREAPLIGPDVALMDIQMNALSDLECVRRLKGVRPGLILILVAGLTDQETMAQAVAAGVEGYLAKPFSLEQCLATVRFVVRRSSTPRRMVEQIDARPAERIPNGPSRFTHRENQVLDGLAKGLLYKEIADRLGISFSAVHKHQHKIFVKLQVSNRTEAIAKWLDGQRL